MAAIEGGKPDIVDLILSKEYVDNKHVPSKLKEEYLLVQDDQGNTVMHHAYHRNQPAIRKSLRWDAGPQISAKLKEVRNYRGKTPIEMLHLQKVIDTDEEDNISFKGSEIQN